MQTAFASNSKKQTCKFVGSIQSSTCGFSIILCSDLISTAAFAEDARLWYSRGTARFQNCGWYQLSCTCEQKKMSPCSPLSCFFLSSERRKSSGSSLWQSIFSHAVLTTNLQKPVIRCRHIVVVYIIRDLASEQGGGG